MRLLHAFAATCLVLALHAGDPELGSFHLEEGVRIISWSDISAALVAQGLVASDANEFLIQVDASAATAGTSDYLHVNSTSVAVVAGTTRVIKAGTPTAPATTNSLYWRPLDNDFSIYPGTDDTPDFPAIVVATVRVFQGPTTQVGGDWVLRAHVKGVYDNWHGEMLTSTPIPLVYGVPKTLTYEQIRGYTNFTDRERDAEVELNMVIPDGRSAGWTFDLLESNGTVVLSTTPANINTYGVLYVGRNRSIRITVQPTFGPAGTPTRFARLGFVQPVSHDSTGGVPGLLVLPSEPPPTVTPVTTTGGGGGGGGCGAGTVGGLILISLFLAHGLRRQRR